MTGNINDALVWNEGLFGIFGDTIETPSQHQMNLNQIKPTKINKIIDYNHDAYEEQTTHVNINDNIYHAYSWFENDEHEYLNQNDYINIILRYMVKHYNVNINDDNKHIRHDEGYQDGSYLRIPDVMYVNDYNMEVIIGWVKNGMNDLFSRKYASNQYNRLQSQYIAFMKYLNDNAKYAEYDKHLILAVPFELYDAAVDMIDNAKRSITNDNIDFRIITEINDVRIPTLIDWHEPEETGAIQSGSMKINGIDCDYDDMIISINDNRIIFEQNPDKSHVINVSDYESIRNENRVLISDLQVNQRLIAYYDENMNIVIANGVNVLRNARFITENAESAPSYSYVRIRCFRNANNDEYMIRGLRDYKHNENHATGKYCKAMSIIRMHDADMCGFDSIKDKAGLNVTEVMDYYHTGKLLMMFAYDDNEKNRLFDYAYELFKNNFTLHDVYIRSNINRNDVIAFIHAHKEYAVSMNYYKNNMIKYLKETASYDTAVILSAVIADYKNNKPVMGIDAFKEKIGSATDISCSQLVNAVNAHGKPLLNAVMRMLALDYNHYSNNGFMNTNKNDDIMEIIDCFQTLSSELNSAVDTLKILMSMNDDNGSAEN